MKKTIALLLALLMTVSLAACGGGKTNNTNTANTASDFKWTRTEYFANEDESVILSIFSLPEDEGPGWMAGFIAGDDIYSGNVSLKDNILKGNVAEDPQKDEYIITIAEEGEDGVLLTLPDGKSYSLKPYKFEEASIKVMVNTEGFGHIETAKEGDPIVFDPNYPMSSSYIGLASPEVYVFEAFPDEDNKFMKWTKDGKDFSTDNPLTVELTESADYVAVFGKTGRDETPVDLSTVTKLGQVLGLPDYGSAAYDDKYVYAFEQDGSYYRAIADMPEDVAAKYFDLDWDDPEYDEKMIALIGDLPVVALENLSEMAPDLSEMESIVGKTGAELLDDGWYNWGWNLDDMEFFMGKGVFHYRIIFEGEVKDPDNFSDEDIEPLVVKSVEFDGLGDYTNIDPKQYQ